MQPLDVLIAFLVLWVFAMVLMVVSSIFLRAPYVPTPMKITKKMVKFADLQGKEVVYDLGAGDGRLLIEAKRCHPGVTAKGFELSPPVFFLGLFLIWKSRVEVTLRMKNLFHQDVSDADCIFLYLMPGAMKTLQKKFEKELKPGTKIISHAFKFPGKEPVKSMPVPWLQGQKELRLYIW
ncbi:MAG: SAM-dependent methyltransferase [bacterium]|nr:SAM-dependent methyltransferase [bacterium]